MRDVVLLTWSAGWGEDRVTGGVIDGMDREMHPR